MFTPMHLLIIHQENIGIFLYQTLYQECSRTQEIQCKAGFLHKMKHIFPYYKYMLL